MTTVKDLKPFVQTIKPIQYYDDGMTESITYPTTTNGVLKTEYTYDNMNRVKTILTKIGSAVINSLFYTYDDNGNIETEVLLYP